MGKVYALELSETEAIMYSSVAKAARHAKKEGHKVRGKDARKEIAENGFYKVGTVNGVDITIQEFEIY